MYRQSPIIETAVDAIDELNEVAMTLSGLSAFTLALANSGMHEPDATRLASCLLDRCAIVAKEASDELAEQTLEAEGMGD